MKSFYALLICLFVTLASYSQETYTIDGQSYELKMEASGSLTLLWNVIDGQYRYFIKKGSAIEALTNSKGPDGNYQEEYKEVLGRLTNQSTDKVKLTLPSLTKFVNRYNAQADGKELPDANEANVQARLLVYGGITNHPFIENPDNTKVPQFGIESEIFESKSNGKHALYLGASHALERDEFNYSNTQLYVGYRFRFMNQEAFNIYGNATLATYNFSRVERSFVNNGQVETDTQSNSDFEAPVSFGIGGDIRVSKNSYITIMYNELVALFSENEGNFSTNIVIGYKFNL